MKMNKGSTRALRNFVLTAIASVLGGCGTHSTPKVTLPSVEVARAQREPISEIVSAEAELFPHREADLAPKIASPIREFLVQRGQRVRKGQLLAVLENRDLISALGEAQGAYEQAEANYATTVSGSLPEQLQKAESDLTNASANLAAQQKLYNSRVILYSQGAMAKRQVDVAAVGLTSAKTQYQAAAAHLKTLKSITSEQTEKSAKARLDTAGAKLSAARAALQYSRIRSPIDGVVAFRNLHEGDIPPVGTPLITVMNVSHVIAKVHLPQDQAAQVKLGDPATLRVDGVDHPISGKVSVVSPALDPNSTTSEIWVEAANPNSELEPGSSATVAITAKTVPDAVVVPSASVFRQNNETEVMVVDSQNTVHLQPVKIGIQNQRAAQVTQGLQAGASIVTNAAYGLPDDTKIQPTPTGNNEAENSTGKPLP